MLAEAADVCVPFSTLNRHLPILRPCLGPRDQALVVAACARSAHPTTGGDAGHLLLLTRYRLVVTSERRLLRRLRLHLNADLSQLAEVAWTAEPTHGGVQLAATAVDGVREHFWIKLGDADRVWRLDALLRMAFLTPGPISGPGRLAPVVADQPAPLSHPTPNHPTPGQVSLGHPARSLGHPTVATAGGSGHLGAAGWPVAVSGRGLGLRHRLAGARTVGARPAVA